MNYFTHFYKVQFDISYCKLMFEKVQILCKLPIEVTIYADKVSQN